MELTRPFVPLIHLCSTAQQVSVMLLRTILTSMACNRSQGLAHMRHYFKLEYVNAAT